MKLKQLLPAIILFVLAASAIAQPPQNEFGGRGNGRAIRGTVTAMAPPFVTIRTDEGETWQVKLGPNARLVKGGQRGAGGESREARAAGGDSEPPQSIAITDIHVGDALAASGDIDPAAKKVNAAFAFVIDAATVKKLAADWGVTYIVGKITALNSDDAKITVQRPDGKTATIQADESTSFRKGRESITLADVKVGDSITARGAVKNGIFTPASLIVFDPNARRGPRGSNPPAEPQPH
jgi:hypothetical protein